MKILNFDDIDDISLEDFEANQESQFLLPASSWRDEVEDLFANGEKVTGDKLPWRKTHQDFRLRPGEVTLWFGYNNHKKSMVVGQVMMWLLETSKVVIASMEMPARITIKRMFTQATGDVPTKAYRDWLMDWSNDRLWIYNESDTVEPRRIHAMINYSAQVLGVKHVVIDSLMKCVRGEDDYNGQKDFVDSLCQAAKRHNIHIHLIHHARKGASSDAERTPPAKHDARGASAIVDLVDNAIAVHCNITKEEAEKHDEPVNEFDPDLTLTVWKQRHGAFTNDAFGLYFDSHSMQIKQNPRKNEPFNPGENFNLTKINNANH